MHNTTPQATNAQPPPAVEDHRVRSEVSDALRATGRFFTNRVDVHASNGVVRLQGRVSSYYHKQMAQAAASAVLGDCQLINEIVVERA